jgi:hypothetical protein
MISNSVNDLHLVFAVTDPRKARAVSGFSLWKGFPDSG